MRNRNSNQPSSPLGSEQQITCNRSVPSGSGLGQLCTPIPDGLEAPRGSQDLSQCERPCGRAADDAESRAIAALVCQGTFVAIDAKGPSLRREPGPGPRPEVAKVSSLKHVLWLALHWC